MKIRNLLTLLVLTGLLAASCSKSKDNDILYSEAGWLAGSLALDASTASEYIDACTVSYGDDGLFRIDITFTDEGLSTSQITPELINFGVACYLKDMQESHMANILNQLSEVEGEMRIKVTDAAGDTLVHNIPAPALKQLYRSNYSEINFSAAKSALSHIFEDEAPAVASAASATGCTYATTGGFAQYTLTFPSERAYGHITQGSLTGRYLPSLFEKYMQMGNFDAYVQNVCSKLGFEGYRYIYRASDDERQVRASMTWNMINSYQPRQ